MFGKFRNVIIADVDSNFVYSFKKCAGIHRGLGVNISFVR